MRIVFLIAFLNLSVLGQSQSVKIPVVNFDTLSHLLSQHSDTTYVTNFWATWCKPCVSELPYFEQVHTKYKDQPVKVVLVSLDFVSQLDEKLAPFLERHDIKSSIMVLDEPDANSWIDKIHPDWTGALPATILYRNDHKQFHEGSFESSSDLFAFIDSFTSNK